MIITTLFPVLLLAMIDHRPVSGAIVLSTFRQQALIEHNFRRQLHCTSPMVLNSTLNAIAQNYSEYLAANNLFQHSGAAGLGENLWTVWTSGSINFINGSTPTISWYNEISAYNYSAPGFASSTGHFTQVIWRNSIQLGVGIALSSNNQTATVVANYYPPGNMIGSFPTNVLPLCSSTTTTTTSSTPNNSTNIGNRSRNLAINERNSNNRLLTMILAIISISSL